jgi:hypothetical protein
MFGQVIIGERKIEIRTLLREQQLVDHDIMRVDLISRQLLHQPLRLIQAQELRDTHTHERCLLRILELRVHLRDHRPHALELGKHVVCARAHPAAHHGGHLVDHGSDAAAEGGELAESLFEHGGEGEEAEGVSCRGGVEDDDGIFH